MKIIFIRHGKTSGNLEKRYIGKTDENLCDIGISELKNHTYPDTEIVICSPLKRCVQTAEIIYPDKKIVTYNGLKECDFGDFEGRNYTELSDNPDYKKWLESMGTMPFPNGEAHEDFVNRCVSDFEKSVSDFKSYDKIAYVIHGGTIMSVLEKFAVPKKSFYDYQVKNGGGYICEYDDGKIYILEEIL